MFRRAVISSQRLPDRSSRPLLDAGPGGSAACSCSCCNRIGRTKCDYGWTGERRGPPDWAIRPDLSVQGIGGASDMKILLVDDHQLFREGVELLLQRLNETLELLQAATCDEAFALCEANPDIDLILLDLNLAGMRGLEGLLLLRERHSGMPVVVLSSVDDAPTIRRAIDAGAMGSFPDSSSEIMLNALRLVLAKGVYLPPRILLAASAQGPFTPLHRPLTANARQTGVGPITPVELGLTPRQADVLYLVLQGKPISSSAAS